MPILPELPQDIAAQQAAVRNPANPKDTMWVPGAGKGRLLTNNPAKAMAFNQAPVLSDQLMAGLLGYPETKQSAIASGNPQVVQGLTPAGAVAHEAVVSPQTVPLAMRQAGAVAPQVRVTTPQGAIGRRIAGLLNL